MMSAREGPIHIKGVSSEWQVRCTVGSRAAVCNVAHSLTPDRSSSSG